MAKLKALFHGQEIADLALEVGQEYIIGRGSNCDIQLPNEKGISRQHLKIYQQADVWVIELLSKTGSLILEGEIASSIELVDECRFSVPPFEFQFELIVTNQEEALVEPIIESEFEDAELIPDKDSEDAIAIQQTASGIDNLSPEATINAAVEDDIDSLDDTMAGVVNLIPVLKVVNEKTGEEYILKLEGNIWTAGRHPDCEIHIQENAISRRHFEIALVGNSYSIKDLGSSNGTHVNGAALEPNIMEELSSGDKISIRHLTIYFEVRDKNHEHKMAGIKELAVLEDSASHTSENPSIGMDVYQGPAVIKMDPPMSASGFLAKPKVKKALMLGAPLLLVIAIFAGGGNDKKDLPSVPSDSATTQKDLDEVKLLLGVARNHYQNQNFSFCLVQLQKLHKILPAHEDSKEMESLCRQAIDLEREQADRDAVNKNQQEVQAKIQNIIDNCAASQTTLTTSAKMQICLQPALELNPEEPRALALIGRLETLESQAQNAEQIKQARASRVRSGKAAYSKAVRLEKQKKFKSAKRQYYSFIRGGYGLRNEEAKARRAIASINKNITAQIVASVTACEKFLSESKYKEAISNCNKALELDNSNAKAKSAVSNVKKRLRIDMKKIWDSSVLEESFGNIEAAKARWKEIVKKSVPHENYYEKARNKLRTYGIE